MSALRGAISPPDCFSPPGCNVGPQPFHGCQWHCQRRAPPGLEPPHDDEWEKKPAAVGISPSPLESFALFGEDEDEAWEPQDRPVSTFHQIDHESISGILSNLDAIRKDILQEQAVHRRGDREQNIRQFHLAHLHSLLLEEADFNPQAVRQRTVQEMLVGGKVHGADVLFFSVDERRQKLAAGPSMKLRDIVNRPHRYADSLVVDAGVLGRMLQMVPTSQIAELVAKCSEYFTFKQTTYQVKRIVDRGNTYVKNATGLAIYNSWIYVSDTQNHCIWRVPADHSTAQGYHDLELFAGCPGQPGSVDGSRYDARFRSPMGIAVCDKTESAFVADTDNNTVRQIDLRHGEVWTIRPSRAAGAAHATRDQPEFRQPKGICVIHGDADMFWEMEASQQKQCERFHAQRQRAPSEGSLRDDASSSDAASNLGGDESHSTFPRSAAEDSIVEIAGEGSKIRGPAPDDDAGGCRSSQDSSELSSGERPKPDQTVGKYSVLQGRDKGPKRQNPDASQRPSVNTNASLMNPPGVGDSDFDETRLAVTSDHGVWIVDPRRGQCRPIAGHADNYGYNDAPLGLAARFSSPRDVINVRSVLFVADYWNNVIRCVDLYTTQVDTVLEFSPQGPAAMCLSHAGELHVLDSEHVYCANVLSIRSAPGGQGSRPASEPASTRGKWHKCLFERPKAEPLSPRAGAESPVGLEMWPTGFSCSNHMDVPRNFYQAPPRVNALPVDFQNRLQSYLEETVNKQEEAMKRKAEKSRRKEKTCDFEHPQCLEQQDKSCSLHLPRDTERLASNSTCINSAMTSSDASSESDPTQDEPCRNSDEPAKLTPPSAKQDVQEPSVADYVEQTRQLLSQMCVSSMNGEDSPRSTSQNHPAPMTLSDLGIDGSGFAPTLTPLHRVPSGETTQYRTFFESCPREVDITPDAGTVVVSGGKTYYRSQPRAWSGRRRPLSSGAGGAASRRPSGSQGVISYSLGEDDDKTAVVELTWTTHPPHEMGSRRPSVPESLSSVRSSARPSVLESRSGRPSVISRRDSECSGFQSLVGGTRHQSVTSGFSSKRGSLGTSAGLGQEWLSSIMFMPTLLDTHEDSEGENESESGDKDAAHNTDSPGSDTCEEDGQQDADMDAHRGEQPRSTKMDVKHVVVELPTWEPATRVSSYSTQEPTAKDEHDEIPKVKGGRGSFLTLARSNTTEELAKLEAIISQSTAAKPQSAARPSPILKNNTSGTEPQQDEAPPPTTADSYRATTPMSVAGNFGTYKVVECKEPKIWRRLPLPESLSRAQRRSESRQPPNTPVSMVWHEQGSECSLFVGLLGDPSLLKVVPPRLHEPTKGGRFNTLPIDAQLLLLADESCHQIWLVNQLNKTKKHLAGCGKRGYLDGPLRICQMHSPCSMALDPHSHHIYVADKGNHVIRRVDLLGGLMSTLVGNGSCGSCDGPERRRQSLDSPFEVSFAEPHTLIISCADNSVRSFNLKTGYLRTLLVGS